MCLLEVALGAEPEDERVRRALIGAQEPATEVHGAVGIADDDEIAVRGLRDAGGGLSALADVAARPNGVATTRRRAAGAAAGPGAGRSTAADGLATAAARTGAAPGCARAGGAAPAIERKIVDPEHPFARERSAE